MQHLGEAARHLLEVEPLLPEEKRERPLRQHQQDQHERRPERGKRGRQLLDHQAPDEHADRDEEMQPRLDGRPRIGEHGVVDVDVLRKVGLPRRHPDAPDVERG